MTHRPSSLLLIILHVFRAVAQIPEGMRGTWAGNITASPLGPIRYSPSHDFLVISAPDASGNSFLRQDDFLQLMRVQDNLMQYCFKYGTPGADEAPFQVMPGSDHEIKFCWRGPRLPTHKAGCTDCECARWTLQLEGDTLHSTFEMSPPVLHLKMDLVRTGPPPSAENVSRGWNCQFDNHTGPPKGRNTVIATRSWGPGTCSTDLANTWRHQNFNAPIAKRSATGEIRNCVVINSQNNVRLQYIASKVPCMPCDVRFTVSADTHVSASSIEYLAVGFKGRYAAYKEASVEEWRDSPDYWGMSAANLGFKESTITGRIVLAYNDTTRGGCVRQLKADAYVGSVVDTIDDGVIRNPTVKTENGRTTITFTISMNAGRDEKELSWHGLFKKGWGQLDVMWAIGQIGDNGSCAAPIQMHSMRGLAALGFPAERFECDTEALEERRSNVQRAMLSTDWVVV